MCYSVMKCVAVVRHLRWYRLEYYRVDTGPALHSIMYVCVCVMCVCGCECYSSVWVCCCCVRARAHIYKRKEDRERWDMGKGFD